MPNLYWPIPLIIGILVFLTGTAVYMRDPTRRLNQVLIIESGIIFLWTIANSMVILKWDVMRERTFWDHNTYAFGFLVAPLFAIFSCYLPPEKAPTKRLISISLLASVGLAFVFFLDVFPDPIGEPSVNNKIYLFFYSSFFVGFFVYGIRNVRFKAGIAKSPIEKKQLNILQMGLFSTFAIGVSAGLGAPILAADSWMMNLATGAAAFVFTIFTGYAVIKYGFLDSIRHAMTQVFTSFNAGIIVIDYNGRLVRANPMVYELLNLREQVEELTITDFAEKVSINIESEAERQMFSLWFLGNEDGEREFGFKEGTRSLLINRKALEDAHGFQTGRIFTFFDVTERKRLTRELQESSDHLEGLLQNANDLIITCDKNGYIISANKMAVKVSGLEGNAWRSQNIFDLIAPERAENIRRWVQSWVRGNYAPSVFQVDLVNVNGERIPLEVSLNKIESAGAIIGVQAIARDIRPRLQAESEIRRLQEINEQIVRNAPTGICTINKSGTIVTVNPAFAQIVGFGSPADLIGKQFDDFPTVIKFSLMEPLQKVFNGQTLEQTFQIQTVVTDKKVNVKAFGTPLTNEQGEITGALIIAADLTREKELERKLIQSEKLSSVGGLISGVAHELNNPLTAIMGYSQFLSLDMELPEKALEMVSKIHGSAERCRKIVANLLGYVRMKPPEKCLVNINELLDKTLELREYDFRVKNITVKRQYQEDLPSTAGDPNQLQQVFLNLINNAFDAIHERTLQGAGLLEIRTFMATDCITIEFTDNGPGIRGADRDRIFDPFFTTKPAGKGTGLGLSLSFGIIRSHGGSIHLDPTHQDGAKFIVKIPIESALKEQQRMQSQPSAIDLHQHVLLVDDEELILECTKMLLESNQFKVTTASSGDEARQKLHEQKFDLIISDLRMPGSIDGKALFHIVQKEMPHLAQKMLFITGDTLDLDTYSFLTTIPNRHVKKPFTVNELLNALAATIGLSAAGKM